MLPQGHNRLVGSARRMLEEGTRCVRRGRAFNSEKAVLAFGQVRLAGTPFADRSCLPAWPRAGPNASLSTLMRQQNVRHRPLRRFWLVLAPPALRTLRGPARTNGN